MDQIDKIHLYHFGSDRVGRLDPSPFCSKLLLYFSLAKIPFESKQGKVSPTSGRCPYIEIFYKNDTNNKKSEIVEDSTRIIELFKTRYQIDLDSHLSAEDKMKSDALILLFENVAYHSLVRILWVDHIDWVKKNYPIPLPQGSLLQSFVMNKIRNGILTSLNNISIGDMSDDESHETLIKCLRAAISQLGDKKYLFSNEKPSLADAALFTYANRVSALNEILPEKIKKFLSENKNWEQEYGKRLEKEAFPNYDEQAQQQLKNFDSIAASFATKYNIFKVVVVAAVGVASFFIGKKFGAF